MKVLVAGAGAVGSWLGAALALGGAAPVLVARGEHADALDAGGITRRRAGATLRTRAPVTRAVADAAALGPFDATIVCVKSYDTAAVAAEIAAVGPALQPPCVASFQNGVGNEAVLARRLPSSTVIAATLTTPVWLPEPGVVAGSSRGGVALARVARDPGSGACADAPHVLAEALRRGGLDVVLATGGERVKWSKLLLNITANATGALLGWPAARVLGDAAVAGLERAAWLEGLAVMDALGVRPVALPGYPVDRVALVVRRAPASVLRPIARLAAGRSRAGKPPGLARDLASARRRSEIDVLNGAIARAGTDRGVPTPVNAALTELVRQAVDGSIAPNRFRDRPADLVAAVRSGGVLADAAP